MKQWSTLARPGYLGGVRNLKFQEWDARFGHGNWRLVWKIGPAHHDFLGACALYEDAYYEHLKNVHEDREQLIREASDVFDDSFTNVGSGLNYFIQETTRTHVQDIAIRRSLVRLGLWFEGDSPVQIRDKLGEHPLSIKLSPGQVPFHRPDLIEQPELAGWWKPQSVEAFYQSNRFLQILEKE